MAAKPDLTGGFLMLAHELDAALALADFTKGARVVLREVFAQIYGMTKAKTASISPSAISDRCGIAREQLSRGVKELVDSGALAKTEDGTYRFIKDYESWLHRGERRLTAKEADYCRKSATKRTGNASEGRDDSVTETVTIQSHPRDDSVTPTVTKLSHLRDDSVTETVTIQSQNRGLPYRNAGAEFDKGEEKNNEDEKTITTVSQTELKLAFSEPEATPSPCPPIPDEDTSMYMIQTGGHRPDDATVQRLFKLAWALFPGTEIANEYWSYQQWFSADVWAAALRKGKQSKPGLDRINYILSIATGYQAKGIPVPKPRSFQPDAAHVRREIVATVAPAGYRDHIQGKRSSESA